MQKIETRRPVYEHIHITRYVLTSLMKFTDFSFNWNILFMRLQSVPSECLAVFLVSWRKDSKIQKRMYEDLCKVSNIFSCFRELDEEQHVDPTGN